MGDETNGGGGSKENENREGKAQPGRRDKAIALYCQSEEAINNSVTIRRERRRVWRSESRVYKRNTTKSGATGASSCWALMGVRSGWLSILCLTAHSSADGPWHPWRNATLLFNPVYTLEGDTMEEVEKWRVRKQERKRMRKGWERWSKGHPKLLLKSPQTLDLFANFLHLLITLSLFVLGSYCTTPLLRSLFSHRVPRSRYAIFPIFSTILTFTEGKKLTQRVYFPWWSWGGQSWDTRSAEDSKSAVSGHIMCVYECACLCDSERLECW